MSIQPLITFKAGRCDADLDNVPHKVRPLAEPGYLYLYAGEEELLHFCWRARDAPLDDANNMDLLMVPGDATFVPYTTDKSSSTPKSPVAGRIFVLKFQSSSARHFYWLQSAAQPASQPSHFSQRDLKIGELVNNLLLGGEVDPGDIEDIRNTRDDDDDEMEDVHGPDHSERRGSGGAGADATGGDVREEGEDSRGGGADGARAGPGSNSTLGEDANTTLQNILKSFQAGGRAGTVGGSGSGAANKPFTTIVDLLPSSVTTAALSSPTMSDEVVSELLIKHVPSSLIYLAHGMDPSDIPEADDPEAVQALVEALEPGQQRSILRRVYQSPQFSQACTSLTSALRDGGLPGVADALSVQVEQGGYLNRASAIPLTGGNAVDAFLNGIKKEVTEKQKK